MRQPSDPRRGRPVTARLYSILVMAGAVDTEKDYFEGLEKSLSGSNRLAVALDVRQKGGVAPDQVVRAAIDRRDRKPGIYDELWLLLHHADCRSHCAGHKDVVARLKKHVRRYDKTDLRFADFAAGVNDAVKRARDLDPTGVDHVRNPSTGVWRLVGIITEKS